MTLTLEAARSALVDYALSCVGLSAHPSNDPARFGRVVAPYGPPAWVQSLCAPTPPNGANSTCEVFAVATDQAVAEQLGLVGLVRPLTGAVEQWAWFVGVAKRLGAHRTVSKDGPPTVGSIVHVESASSRHWYRVVESRNGAIQGARSFVTVDGGQNDRGYQAIAKCARAVRGTFEAVNGTLGRAVIDWIDSPALLVALAAGGASNVIPQRSPNPSPIGTSTPGTSPTMPTIRRGSSGDTVRNWQGIVGVTVDGAFGPATERETKAWQEKHGLAPDGVVGPATWAAAGVGGTVAPAPTPTRPGDAGATLPQVPGLLEREAREPGFCRTLLGVLTQAGANVDRVTALMAEESRFNPAAHNPAGGASGLLQWMPFLWTNAKTGPAFRAVAPTPEALRALTATQQLPLVAYTLQLWGKGGAQDPALAGWGSNVGSPDDTILATKDEPGRVAFYRDNAGYDRDRDGHITAGEVRAAVYGLLVGATGKPRVGPDGRAR